MEAVRGPADRIAEIRARLENRTRGQWEVRGYGDGVEDVEWGCFVSADMDVAEFRTREDAELVANAPEDIEWLLDRLEWCERKLDRIYTGGDAN